MREHLLRWLDSQGYPHTDLVVNIVMICLIILTTLLLHAFIHYGLFRFLGKRLQASKLLFLNILSQQRLFSNLALTIQGVLLAVQLRIWLPVSEWREGLITLTNIWCLVFGLLAIFALLDTLQTYLFRRNLAQHFPVRGLVQTIKLLASIGIVILLISLLLGQSPLILLSGLGAMTAVLALPRLGCLNIHASLLPRWRGAAPIHRAIEAGDAETGVTIMQMDAGLDTGDMLLTERLPIAPSDTTATLHDRLATLGGRMIVEALELAACGGLTAVPQPADGITYAHKIEKAESTIDWTLPAAVIGQRIRAFDPFPGASTECNGETIKIWSYAIDSVQGISNQRPGQILAADGAGVTVACGSGTALRLTTLQRAGGKRLAAADFLRGFDLQPGMVLGANPA